MEEPGKENSTYLHIGISILIAAVVLLSLTNITNRETISDLTACKDHPDPAACITEISGQ